ITTLTVIERSQSEVDAAYEMSMRAARELAGAGVDLVFLGGVPVNLSRGDQNAQVMLQKLAAELGVKVSSSVAAQGKAAKVLACKKVVVAHPLWRARGCATDRRRPTLWLRSARRHGMWQGHQTLRPHPGDGRARHGSRADARAPARRRDLFPFTALAGDR